MSARRRHARAAIIAGMPRSAPRIAWPLVEALAALDERGLAIAELWRRLGTRATELGLPRPSYQQTRMLAHRARRIRALPGAGDLVVDVLFRARSPQEAADEAERRLRERHAARVAVDAERTWRPPGT